MTRIGAQKTQRIVQILSGTLTQAADVCFAAEYLIPYVLGEADSSLPPLPENQAACSNALSLLEMFVVNRPRGLASIL
jgi:hypothetical protein